MAIQLRFSHGLIDTIDKNNKKAEDAFDDMIQKWLDGAGGTREPITWRTLLTVFQEVERNVLAADLEKILPVAL